MTTVVIGNFDGVHRGHQSVIAQARGEAHGDEVVILTFDPHPAEVLGRKRPPRLTTLPRRLELLKRHGADRVVVEPFTPALAALLPAQFAEDLLVNRLSAKTVVVGENFRFGKDRSGDLTTLQFLGKALGFRTIAAVVAGDGRGPFSSTRARDAVARGDLAAAEEVLGRHHEISGVVEKGDQIGRTIGFPTANLGGVAELLPPHGIYAVMVDDKKGALYIGNRPTIAGEPKLRVEVNLLDFEGDLYGSSLRVRLVKYLRGDRQLDGLDALKAQIAADVAAAREALAGM